MSSESHCCELMYSSFLRLNEKMFRLCDLDEKESDSILSGTNWDDSSVQSSHSGSTKP